MKRFKNNLKFLLCIMLMVSMMVSMMAPALASTGEGVEPCTEHSYGEEITTAATCAADGVKTFTCSVCGDKYTEVIPATGEHVYTDGKCANCGAEEPKAEPQPETCATCSKLLAECQCTPTEPTVCEHSFAEGVCSSCGAVCGKDVDHVLSESSTATCEAAGVQTLSCTVCGAFENCDVPALGHSYDPATHKCIRCGAEEPMDTSVPPLTEADCICESNCNQAADSGCAYCQNASCPKAVMPVVENPVAKIGDVPYATFDEALTAASSMTGDVVIDIYKKVTLNKSLSGSYSSINFVGKNADAEIYMDVQGAIYASGKNVSFKDLKLSKVAGGYVADAGFRNLAFGIWGCVSATYTNCTFLNGAYASSGTNTFTNCVFQSSHDRYSLWAYGDSAAIIVDACSFVGIRGIKMYSETQNGSGGVNLTVKNTDLSASDGKPAIVLTYGKGVTLENNTYPTTGMFELDLDGKPNGTSVTSDVPPTCVNDNGACGVLVDGKVYTTVAQAAAAATSGSTVKLLHNSAETVELPAGVKLEKNGFAAESVTVAPPVAKIGEAEYGSISAAVAAANAGDTVTLQKNVSIENTIKVESGKTITLDLGGKTITTGLQSGSDDKHIYAFDNLGTLYIVGPGTINARGIYNGYNNNNPVSSASMHIDSGVTINAIDTNGGYGVANYGTIYIDGAKITAKEDTVSDEAKPGNYDASAFANFGTATINSGTFESTTNYTYAITNQGTLTIETAEVSGGFGAVSNLSGSTVIKNGNYEVTGANGGHAVYAESGTVTIQNGTFTPNSGSSSYAICTAGANAEVAVVDGNFGVGAQGSVCVTTGGGEVNLQGGSYDGRVFVNDPAGSLEITGGTFSEVPDDKYIHEDYKSEKNTDGKFEVAKLPAVAKIGSVEFTSFEKALEESKSGDTIVLLKDLAGLYTLSEGVTLDLNGKTLTGNVVGTVSVNGGKWVAPSPAGGTYDMLAPSGTAYFLSTDAVLTIGTDGSLTMQSGTVSLGQSWRTDLGQAVTIGEDAEFVVPANMEFSVRGHAVVDGKTTVNGSVLLGGLDVNDASTVSLKAPTGLNVVSGVDDYYVFYKDGKYSLKSEDAAVASIGNSLYPSVSDAIAAAKDGDTVKIIKAEGSVSVTDKDITIDLDGAVSEDFALNVKDSTVTISGEDLAAIKNGAALENSSLKVGDNTVGMTDGAVSYKKDSKELYVKPAAGAVVSVNGAAISFENVNSSVTVVMDEKGNAALPADATVTLSNGSKIELDDNANLDKAGVLTVIPAKIDGAGYGSLVIKNKDGSKFAVLVALNKNNDPYVLTIKLDKDNKFEYGFIDKDAEAYIIDDKADYKDYLEVIKADKYFYKYGVGSMRFTINGFYGALNKVSITSADGKYYKELGSKEADMWTGSTEIKLKNSYLKNLELGKYTLTVSYDDGQSVSTQFTVGSTPATGDNGFGEYAAVMAIALAGMAAIIVLLKKRSRA